MARDAIAITALTTEAVNAAATGTAINTTNGGTIAGVGDTNRLLIEIENSAAAEKEVTIKAGDTNPPAVRRGLGDLVLKIAEKSTVKVLVESARHKNKDGSISIDYASGTTGKVFAYRVPKVV